MQVEKTLAEANDAVKSKLGDHDKSRKLLEDRVSCLVKELRESEARLKGEQRRLTELEKNMQKAEAQLSDSKKLIKDKEREFTKFQSTTDQSLAEEKVCVLHYPLP